MSKKSKRKNHNRKSKSIKAFPDGVMFQDEGGEVHSLVAGAPPSKEKLEEMTRVYQENIRNSPLWDMMVSQFGLEKAEELIKEFRVELR